MAFKIKPHLINNYEQSEYTQFHQSSLAKYFKSPHCCLLFQHIPYAQICQTKLVTHPHILRRVLVNVITQNAIVLNMCCGSDFFGYRSRLSSFQIQIGIRISIWRFQKGVLEPTLHLFFIEDLCSKIFKRQVILGRKKHLFRIRSLLWIRIESCK